MLFADPTQEDGVREDFLPRPDGVEDRYVQNPVWGSILQINNDGRRDYEAFVDAIESGRLGAARES